MFQVWLRNRLLYAKLEPVLSYFEKSCMASYYRQFSTNIKIQIIPPIGVNKTGFNLIIVQFYYPKLSNGIR